jgi:hypothetical protein
MKEWHLEHVEKAIILFAKGIPPDASSFEKKNYKRYGTISHCVKQIEYDMKHGVEKTEVMEVLRKIRLNKKYAELRSNAEAIGRLEELQDQLSGARKLEQGLTWYNKAYWDRK